MPERSRSSKWATGGRPVQAQSVMLPPRGVTKQVFESYETSHSDAESSCVSDTSAASRREHHGDGVQCARAAIPLPYEPIVAELNPVSTRQSPRPSRDNSPGVLTPPLPSTDARRMIRRC